MPWRWALFFFFFITLGLELSDTKSTSLKYEPSSEPLLITVKQLFPHQAAEEARREECLALAMGTHQRLGAGKPYTHNPKPQTLPFTLHPKP